MRVSNSPITIRQAGLDDVATLSQLSTTTFTQTFGHLYDPADLDFFLTTTYSHEAYGALVTDPSRRIWLASDGDQAVGYALAGPCDLPHPEVEPGDGEIKRLYLLADHQGAGTGSRLFETALDWLLADGPRNLWLGVWSLNFGAQKFYDRYGFAKVGEYEFPVGNHRDHEFIYRRAARV